MQLATVLVGGEPRAGILDGKRVLVTEARGLASAIATGYDFTRASGEWHALADVHLDAPLRPPVVLCTGQNYRDHLDEKAPVEVSEPEFFLKAGQTIAPPDEPALLDARVTAKLDYETELGVVIGRPGRAIPRERALEHVFGYVVVNDLTARDRQIRPLGQGRFATALGPGKNFDGATRFAPWVTSAAAVGDPNTLQLTTRVNDELRQANSTRNMLFDVGELVSYLSQLLTLPAATVIATGTPGGTGWGQDHHLGGTGATPPGCKPGRYLAPGDRVESEVERVGLLEFDIVAAA
jgi:2-keto-4-pentenoate hydratase/2-oxohepta-3-ene-1,7-dioic acid hydratase in catechol pathway